MIIGCLKLPNKWATTAAANNQPFVYRSSPPAMYSYNDAWGNLIRIDPWFNNYKIICQDGYKITEFWCVNLTDGQHDNLLVPVLMKRYMNNEFAHKAFLLKNGIFDLLMETNKEIPNFNRAYLQQYGSAELLMECLSEKPGLFQEYERLIEELRVSGGLLTRFPSGTPFPMDEVLRRCTPVELYARSTVNSLNETTDLRELNITDKDSLRRFFMEATPVNLLTGVMEVEWIGEQILLQNLTNFTFQDIKQATMITPNTHNLMSILSDTVQREELIICDNFTTNSILEDYAIFTHGDQKLDYIDSTYSDILDRVDMIINSLILDDATTYAVEFDMPTGTTNCIERIYGYGYNTLAERVGRDKPTTNEISYLMMDLCEVLNAVRIRLIKTFNEELFVTITYNSKVTRSYYYNLIAHACVSGCLFSA